MTCQVIHSMGQVIYLFIYFILIHKSGKCFLVFCFFIKNDETWLTVENDYKDAIGHKWMKYKHINNHINLYGH